MADFLSRLHDARHYARHFCVASDRMKARRGRLVNSSGFREGDYVWLYRPTLVSGKPPKLPLSWVGPCKVIYPDERFSVQDVATLQDNWWCTWPDRQHV